MVGPLGRQYGPWVRWPGLWPDSKGHAKGRTVVMKDRNVVLKKLSFQSHS